MTVRTMRARIRSMAALPGIGRFGAPRLRAARATIAVAMAASAAGCAVGSAPAEPIESNHLTLTVTNSANPSSNGTFELLCHPTSGNHPATDAACAKVDRISQEEDPFAPLPADIVCTQQYGGPEVARLTGTWAGRPVDATFNRTNGCEISRWDSLVPLLPAVPA